MGSMIYSLEGIAVLTQLFPYYTTNQLKNINTAKPPWTTKNEEPLLTISLKKKNHH